MKTTLLNQNAYRHVLFALIMAALLLLSGCETSAPKPSESTPTESKTAINQLSALDETRYLKALDELEAGKEKRAHKTLQSLTKKYPGHVGAHINLASAYYKLDNLKDAKIAAEQALALNTKVAETHNILGLLAVEEKSFQEAEAAYLKAIKLNKLLANAHYNLALLYDIYFQDIAKAYQSYHNYLKLRPDDTEVRDWVEQLKYSLEQTP